MEQFINFVKRRYIQTPTYTPVHIKCSECENKTVPCYQCELDKVFLNETELLSFNRFYCCEDDKRSCIKCIISDLDMKEFMNEEDKKIIKKYRNWDGIMNYNEWLTKHNPNCNECKTVDEVIRDIKQIWKDDEIENETNK